MQNVKVLICSLKTMRCVCRHHVCWCHCLPPMQKWGHARSDYSCITQTYTLLYCTSTALCVRFAHKWSTIFPKLNKNRLMELTLHQPSQSFRNNTVNVVFRCLCASLIAWKYLLLLITNDEYDGPNTRSWPTMVLSSETSIQYVCLYFHLFHSVNHWKYQWLWYFPNF